MYKRDNSKYSETTMHADFSICTQCEPCGGGCTFLNNSVTFVKNPKNTSITGLTYDTSLKTCGAECGKHCVTNFRLSEALKPEV